MPETHVPELLPYFLIEKLLLVQSSSLCWFNRLRLNLNILQFS